MRSSQREAQTSTLYSLSRDLTTAVGLEDVLKTIIGHIGETISRETVILLPKGETLEVRVASPGFILGEDEQAVALWAYQHGQPAGRGTPTLPAASVRYLPLKTTHGTVGVLGAKPTSPGDLLSPEQRQFLDAYANLAALAIERAQLDEQASQAQVLRATEKLQSALLNSISHDLRTPLASITGALDSLAEAEQDKDGMIQLTQRSSPGPSGERPRAGRPAQPLGGQPAGNDAPGSRRHASSTASRATCRISSARRWLR